MSNGHDDRNPDGPLEPPIGTDLPDCIQAAGWVDGHDKRARAAQHHAAATPTPAAPPPSERPAPSRDDPARRSPAPTTADGLEPPAGWQAPLADLLNALAMRKYAVMLILGGGIGLGLYMLAKTPPFYVASAQAVLLPREKPPVDLAVSVGGIKGDSGGARREDTGALMLPANPELYTSLAHSEGVLRPLADQFEKELGIDPSDRSVEVLSKVESTFKLTGTDDGLLTVEAKGNSGKFVADFANALMQQLERASKMIERGLVLRQAGFLDAAITRISNEQKTDQARLTAFCEEHAIVNVSAQVMDVLRLIREAKSARGVVQQQWLERRAGYTEEDAVMQALEARMREHDAQIEKLRNEYFGRYSEEEFAGILVDYEELRSKVQFGRDLVATLKSQREVFNIRAEEPAGSLAIISVALEPARPAGPSKKKTLGLAIGVSLVLAIGYTVLTEQVRLALKEPYIQARLGDVSRNLKPRWPGISRLLFWRRKRRAIRG